MPRFYNSYDREQVRPVVGSTWAWMNREIITVTSVRWNGEEWWIGTRGLKNDLPGEPFEYWNDLSRFWEACHHIRREPGPPGGKGPTRKGPPQGTELEPSDA